MIRNAFLRAYAATMPRKQISMVISDEERALLIAIAKHHGKTMSAAMRLLIWQGAEALRIRIRMPKRKR